MISSIQDETIRTVYYQLFRLFAYITIEVHAVDFISSGTLNSVHMGHIQNLKEELYESLAPHALKLAEAIPFDENTLASAIAHSNEKPYENLYNWAREFGTLNRHGGVHPAVRQRLLPFMEKRELKLTRSEREIRDRF